MPPGEKPLRAHDGDAVISTAFPQRALLDLVPPEAYIAPMDFRQTVLVSMLAAAVTLAGVVCACAVPAIDADGHGGAHHAHHENGQALVSMDCDHADCGDCTANGAVSKHDVVRDHAPQLPEAFLDDDGPAGITLAAITSVLRGFFWQPPLPRPVLTADTPVRRFDKLLS